MSLNNLHNIVVYIKDEAMLQEARGILEANGQHISKRWYFLSDKKLSAYNYLRLDRYWWIGHKSPQETEITLHELEQLLKKNRDNQSK